MRHKDEGRMAQILEFVDSFFDGHLRAPSTSEIGQALGIAKSTAHNYLCAMHEKHMLSYVNGQITTEHMTSLHSDVIQAPIVGPVSCGLPESVDAYAEEYVPLSRSIFGKGEIFILRADGTSMINAGIEPGDLVVVRRQEIAHAQDVVVAVNGQHETTLKRLMWDGEEGRYYLHPENDAMEDMYPQSIKIQGVATHVIKTL